MGGCWNVSVCSVAFSSSHNDDDVVVVVVVTRGDNSECRIFQASWSGGGILFWTGVGGTNSRDRIIHTVSASFFRVICFHFGNNVSRHSCAVSSSEPQQYMAVTTRRVHSSAWCSSSSSGVVAVVVLLQESVVPLDGKRVATICRKAWAFRVV